MKAEERGVACFMDDFEACIAHLRFPATHRGAIRTTNLFELLFVEERRRLKIIPNAFGERAVLKLMFGALTEPLSAGDARSKLLNLNVGSWLHQKELGQEYEPAIGVKAKLSKGDAPVRLSSNSRT